MPSFFANLKIFLQSKFVKAARALKTLPDDIFFHGPSAAFVGDGKKGTRTTLHSHQ